MTLTKRQEVELRVVELKIVGFLLGVTRNDYIRETDQVEQFGDKVRTYAEEVSKICWIKNMELGYSEGGHKEDWCGRRRCKGQGEIAADCTGTEKT